VEETLQPSTNGVGVQRRWLALWSLVAALAIGGILFWVLKPAHHQVVVTGLGDQVTFSTTEQQLGAALRAHGIELGAKDQISLPLTTPLKGKQQIALAVRKALPVTVVADGKSHQVQSTADSVADLLKELTITLKPEDGLSADPSAALTAGMTVSVVRRLEEVAVATVEVPYQLVREENSSMAVGQSEETRAGQPGIKEIKNITYYEDGKAVRSDRSETVVKEPVNQVVSYGTMEVVSRPTEVVSRPAVASRSGSTAGRYSRQLEVSATGYTAGKESNPDGNGYTYTGMKAVRGIVAVDPNVIPLYSRLYIPGYGEAIAADTGGAIKGNKIDLCFDSLAEALDWGRRPVTVYIIGD
jgi:3D (Asp-Asp-Asp) domain-containing protein